MHSVEIKSMSTVCKVSTRLNSLLRSKAFYQSTRSLLSRLMVCILLLIHKELVMSGRRHCQKWGLVSFCPNTDLFITGRQHCRDWDLAPFCQIQSLSSLVVDIVEIDALYPFVEIQSLPSQVVDIAQSLSWLVVKLSRLMSCNLLSSST